MTLSSLHLSKALKLCYADSALLTKMLRQDIRQDIKKAKAAKSSGGDFYAPFWHDAKLHASGSGNILELTNARIATHEKRKKLYPLLSAGFIDWWDNKRRWTNKTLTFEKVHAKSRFEIAELGTTIKIEGALGLKIGDDESRVIYPYFAKEPILNEEAAKIGLWVLTSALSIVSADEIRILDVFRGKSYSLQDLELSGNEEPIFTQKFLKIAKYRQQLLQEYH